MCARWGEKKVEVYTSKNSKHIHGHQEHNTTRNNTREKTKATKKDEKTKPREERGRGEIFRHSQTGARAHPSPSAASQRSAPPPAPLASEAILAPNASLLSSGKPQYPVATEGDDIQISPTPPPTTSSLVSGSTMISCTVVERTRVRVFERRR